MGRGRGGGRRRWSSSRWPRSKLLEPSIEQTIDRRSMLNSVSFADKSPEEARAPRALLELDSVVDLCQCSCSFVAPSINKVLCAIYSFESDLWAFLCLLKVEQWRHAVKFKHSDIGVARFSVPLELLVDLLTSCEQESYKLVRSYLAAPARYREPSDAGRKFDCQCFARSIRSSRNNLQKIGTFLVFSSRKIISEIHARQMQAVGLYVLPPRESHDAFARNSEPRSKLHLQ